MTGLRSL